MHTWVDLTMRYGNVIQNPTDKNLQDALDELFTIDDKEHPDAWIEYTIENGPLTTFSIYSGGYAIYDYRIRM